MPSRLRLPFLVLTLPLAIAASVSAAPARPATDVSGVISQNTTWTAAASPYVTSDSVEVAAGATLTIEPGVVVRLGEFDQLLVKGALRAIGTAGQPITLEAAADGQPWADITFDEGSGPSEIAHADISGGGARRRTMVRIASDAVLLRDCRLHDSIGVGIDIVGGASPVVRDSHLVEVATDLNVVGQPAALRITGASDAVITGNFFQGNINGAYWDANANPVFSGNRFAFNGHDGVLISGFIERHVTLANLGPRRWSYRVRQPGLIIQNGAQLDIEAGATLRFGSGYGIQVRGTLQVQGESGGKVMLTSDSLDPGPGQWADIYFLPASAPYDVATGEGSFIDHAILEKGGSPTTGMVHINATSPRITNTILRRSGTRGMTVRSPSAQPQLVGLVFDDNTSERDGAALHVEGEAEPAVSFSIFRNNRTGTRVQNGGRPQLGPHNRFERSLEFGVQNRDDGVCIEAGGNDWTGGKGPLDASRRTDACGLADNDGDGDLVSDHVNYLPYEGTLERPYITGPRCGTLREHSPEVIGFAPPGSTVEVYDAFELIGTTVASTEGVGVAPFTFSCPSLADGSHVLHVRAVDGERASGISDPLEFSIDPDLPIDAAGIHVHYDLDGTHFVQPFQDSTGCLSLRGDGDWSMRVHPGVPLTLVVPIDCASGATTATVSYLGVDYPMTDRGDGSFEATFPQGSGGPLTLMWRCGTSESEILLGTVNIEFGGFVHDASKGDMARINGATVILEVWDSILQNYTIWDGALQFGQTNPQTTGLGGWFAFYPEAGLYRVRAEAKGFRIGFSEPFWVQPEPSFPIIALEPIPRQYTFLPAVHRN